MRYIQTLLLASASITAALASTTYTQGVTSQSSITILGSTHQLGCNTFSVTLVAVGRPGGASGRISNSNFTYSINSNYDVSINVNYSFTGNVVLTGCWSNTTNSSDFQVTADVPNNGIVVAAGATDSNYSARTLLLSGKYVSFVVTTPSEFMLSPSSTDSGTLYVYIDPANGWITYGFSSASVAGTWHPGSQGDIVAYGITGYPTGTVPLGHVAYASGAWGSVTDDRTF